MVSCLSHALPDICDTVNYKEVMKQYGLGPNGGIVTSLNLFATRFDQVMGFIEQRIADHSYVVMDTPGQIEVFTWSASGTIITETLVSGATHWWVGLHTLVGGATHWWAGYRQ